MALTSPQRKKLRSLAHSLDPIVLIGKQGLTDTLVLSTEKALEAHELIKVRFNEFKREKKEIAAQLAERTGAELAGIIGHVAILFRQNEDPDKQRIDIEAK